MLISIFSNKKIQIDTLWLLRAVARKRADSNLPPFFRHGFVTVVPWETLAGEQAGESVLPRSKI